VFVTFLVAGFGNGLMLVHERLIILATVPDQVSARVFGVKDALTAWAFALAFVLGGGLVAGLEARPVILLAGAGGLLVVAGSTLILRRGSDWDLQSHGRRSGRDVPQLGSDPSAGSAGANVLTGGRTREHEANVVDSREHWLTLLDDLG
jgi:hypothetical protein